jgi:hypothetical protein
MHYRFIIALAVIFALSMACGSTKKLEEKIESKKQELEKQKEESTQPQSKQTLSGTGTKTQKVTLSKGAAIFNYTYKGQMNFIVWLKDSDAQEVSLIANEIGSSSGSKSVNIRESGTYLIDVKSDGKWTLDIE